MTYYRRTLPHWQPGGKDLFVTWRLCGSLPAGVQAPATDPGKAFLAIDRELDQAASGPTWLKDPPIAQLIVDTLYFGQNQLKLYDLIAYVTMTNHVHVLLHPYVELARITKSIKNFTARKANEILGRPSEPFWQAESFDHWVRGPDELRRIITYIERNPVAAGLVEKPQDWVWSSVRRTGKDACPTE